MFAGETVRFVRMKSPMESQKVCLARQLKHQARTAKVRILLFIGKC